MRGVEHTMSARQGKRLRRRFHRQSANFHSRASPGLRMGWISSTASALTLIIDRFDVRAPSTARWAVAQRQPVHRRAMGMAVDHPAHVVAQHRLFDCLRVDVHDGFRLVLVGLLAAGAHVGGDLQSPAQQRQRQEQF